MKKSDLFKLAEGDRVVVSGKQDGTTFSDQTGTVVTVNPTGAYGGLVQVEFDDWRDGHGDNDSEWNFYRDDAAGFTITKEGAAKKKRPKGAQEYRGNGKHDWETVTGNTMRLRVPGGWLYGQYSISLHRVVQSTFVPTPEVVGYAI